MAEALLLSVVRGVVGKAGDALVKRLTLMWGVDSDREKLEDRLVYVSRMLADAEVKAETDDAVGRWMKKLKAAAYQADDVLDDFQYEALHREAQGLQSMTRKVLNNFTRHNSLLFRLKMSGELKNVLDKIDSLVEEMNKFHLVEHAVVPQTFYRQTHSVLDEHEEIFGRNNEKDVIVKLLLNQQDHRGVQVLPIIGMGGLGKTTLAKMVYNDSSVQKHFELKMWYCVSENFEAPAIVRSVIELATNGSCDLPDKMELLGRRLKEVIGQKRFLLILDDVWNEDENKWKEDLRSLLCSSSLGGPGSMIVVTSRLPQVANIMGTLPTYKLKILSEDDSWKLFSVKAFVNKGLQEQTELDSAGKRIVSKCMGLPLALKTMGGLMSSIQRVQDWDVIADRNIGDTGRDIMSILKLSYLHLSSEMKQCFAFCALFPKDYEMEKDMLIQLWMANGYIHEDATMDLEQKGEFIFNYLIWGSFLQGVTIKRRVLGAYYRFFSKQETYGCKMHDLMHDLANGVDNEYATINDSIRQKISVTDIRHLHIFKNHQLKKISPLLEGTIYLRTLLTPQSSSKDLTKIKLMPSRALRCLCKDPSIISRQFIRTTHLRYLDISYSTIVRLPNSVCALYNLQTLRLNSCSRLQYLPEDMRTMRKLSHLYLLKCQQLKRMPPELGLLHNLRTLTTFVVDTKDGCGIDQLKDLRQLGNRLELYNLRKVKSGSKVNLHEKQNLSELLLYWGHGEFDVPRSNEAKHEQQVLESLAPHGKLKILEVHGYGGLEISQWMRDPEMFRCLRELIITNCPGCKDLPIVWISSCLEHLSLRSMDSITTLCKSNVDVEARRYGASVQIFPKLKRLDLSYLPQLVRWTENNATLTFPLLKKLTIMDCNKLASLPDCPALSHLNCNHSSEEHLVSMSLPLGSWPSLFDLEVKGAVNVVMPLKEQEGKTPLENLRSLTVNGDDSFLALFDVKLRDLFTCVVKLQICNCLNIVRWPVDEFRCLPALQYLSICFCHNLVEDGSSSSEEIFPLPQLRMLRIRGCGGLKALPDGMEGLTSLEDLEIWECPGIKKFPHGLLQRLTTLKRLSIYRCPNLQRRCRKGGEYFDLVSSISNL